MAERDSETNDVQLIQARKRWMGLLARANENQFNSAWDALNLNPEYTIIKPAEQGLVMVRGRAGGSGHPFNLGEMTVTRCSIRLENGVVGQAYIQGRKSSQAEKAAVLDALMQIEEQASIIEEKVLSKLEAEENQRRTVKSRKAAATRVDFFTMVRGED